MAYADESHPIQERRARVRKKALVVDGDVLSRIETRLMLEMHGYQVEEVSDGIEAIGLMDLDSPRLDLVVLDYWMPLLDGMETLYALRALQPGLLALLCVAHGEEALVGALPEGIELLAKPCTMHELSAGLDKLHKVTRHTLEHGKLASSHRMWLSGGLPHYPPR